MPHFTLCKKYVKQKNPGIAKEKCLMPFNSILIKTALILTHEVIPEESVEFSVAALKQNMYWKRCKNVDWNSVLLVLVTFVLFIVRVSSEGQNHTTLQWAYIVDSKQGSYTLVKYCVSVIRTDKPKRTFEIWWPCASLGCKGHSYRLWFSLPGSPVSPSFICLSLIHPSLFVISSLSWIWPSSHCSVSRRFLPSLKSLERSLLNQRHLCATSACTFPLPLQKF